MIFQDAVTLEGLPVARVEVEAPPDVPPLRDRPRRDGIACHEAAVRFAMRYLNEHYVQKQVRPVAEPVLGLLGLDFEQVSSG